MPRARSHCDPIGVRLTQPGYAGVMLKQVIAEMEHAKDTLDRGLLFRSHSSSADATSVLGDMADAAASGRLLRSRCSAALASGQQDSSTSSSAPTSSTAAAVCEGGGRGGAARKAMLEEVCTCLSVREGGWGAVRVES